MVYGDGLENRCSRKRTVGSNPTSSAMYYMKTEPLLKALTAAGTGSRRKMADAIQQNRVSVNDEVATNFRHLINVATDRISIDGRAVNLSPGPAITLMLHKPKGVVSTVSDERGRRKVTDLLPEKYRRLRLYPVGRLDQDSTGLLLVTNDGNLTYRLTHPRFEHEKEYLVHIEDSLTTGEKRRLEWGLQLDDGLTQPAKVEKAAISPFNYRITLHEGRKRQVRRMFAHLSHRVLALKRIRVGNLVLGNLPEGKMRELSAQEGHALLNPD